MKKFLGISIIAVLTILPIVAHADGELVPVAGDPGDTVSDAPMATNGPRYGLKNANAEVDNNLVTAGYVKGAYNAAIKAINKVSDLKQNKLTDAQMNAINNVTTISGDVDALKSAVGGESSGLVKEVADLKTAVGDANNGLTQSVANNAAAIQTLQTNAATYATQNGAKATAGAAVNGAIIDLSGIQPVTGKVGGSASAKITVMDTWGSDTPVTNLVTAPVDLDSTTVVTGLTGNTANQANKISAGTVSYVAN